MSVFLYTGNGSTQTITNGIDLAGEGGLVWIKSRSAATDNQLFDTERGATEELISNSTAAESADADTLTAFNADGFDLGADSNTNTSAATYCSWTFRKAAKFFDVVTYTGNGTTQTINHSLGSVPGLIIIKRSDGTSAWIIWHRSLASTYYLQFTTAAASDSSNADYFGNNVTTVEPTSTSFTLGQATAVNGGFEYVAYLFAHDTTADGLIQCGSFTGTGAAAGVTVNLGWEPQWIMIKRTDSAAFRADWEIYDNMRGLVTGAGLNTSDDARLRANLSSAEDTTSVGQANATGFTLDLNGTYIYIAIRRGPMKTPTVGTEVYTAIARSGTGSSATITGSGFPIDFVLGQERTAVGLNGGIAVDRMRGAAAYLRTPVTNAEGSNTAVVSALDNMDGFTVGASDALNGSSSTYVNWLFRRAPGFFDVVAYTGTGSATTVSHNLGVVPEFCIVKRRDATAFWPTWSSAFTSFQYVALNETSSKYDDGSSNQTFSFTSTGWSIGTTYSSVNASGATYIAYLFATCPGVSKVGSYTGTGTTLSIDCGFTAGARLVLIKRTDSTGDWFVWDTARGIISGDDSYLLLNSTAAEVTNTDYIDPLSSGFQISSTAPAAINASGGTYIFLSVA
jgi:hypothetical protein